MGDIRQTAYLDTSSVMAALAKLEQKQQSLDEAQKRGSARARADNQQQSSSLSSLWDQATTGATGYLTKMFAISKAVDLVGSAISAVTEKNVAWSDSIGDLDKRMDEMRAKLGGQMGGATEKQSARAIEHATDIAIAMPSTGSTLEVADIRRKLSGAGFDEKLTKSGTLDALTHELNVLTGNYGEGTNAVGGAEMLIKGLSALPKEKQTDEEARKLVTEVGNAFQYSTAEKPELFRFFQENGLLNTMGANRQEELALFTMAQQELGSDRAGTGLKNFAQSFNVVKEGSKEESLLSELDLERTALHTSRTGSLLNSTKMLEEAMTKKGWDKIKRDEFRQQFFGEQGSPVANFALTREKEVRERSELLSDEKSTDKVTSAFMKTDMMVRNRQKLESEKLRTRETERAGFTFEDIERSSRLAFDKRRAEAGGDFIKRNIIGAEEVANAKVIATAKAAGVSPEAMIGVMPKEVVDQLKTMSGFMETLIKVTKEQKDPRNYRNAGVEQNIPTFFGG